MAGAGALELESFLDDNDNPDGLDSAGTLEDFSGSVDSVSSGLYPNLFASSASSFAFFSMASKSISSCLLILRAASLELRGPLPLDDKIDFLALPAAVLLAKRRDALALVVGLEGSLVGVPTPLPVLPPETIDELSPLTPGVALLDVATGFVQLEKKSSVEPVALEGSLMEMESEASSMVTMSGCLIASSCAFCFNFSLYFTAALQVYFAVASTPLVRDTYCEAPFFIKNSFAVELPPNLK